MSQTFLDLQTEIKRRAFKDQSGTTFTTAAKSLANAAQLTLSREFPWKSLRRIGSISAVVSTNTYNLPIDFGRGGFFYHEGFGHPYVMQYTMPQDFFESGVSLTQTGIPTHYLKWGFDNVITQPSSASVIQISSSSSSDTNIEVTIYGTVSSFPDFEKITTNGSNGTTAVNGSKSFSAIERITVEQSRIGRITCTTNATAVTNATLPVGDTANAFWYQKVRLWPEPAASLTINVHYYKRPFKLVEDEEVHELGPDFDEAIILLATHKAMTGERQKDDADRFWVSYQQELKNLRHFFADELDHTIIREKRHRRDTDRFVAGARFSQFGSNFGQQLF